MEREVRGIIQRWLSWHGGVACQFLRIPYIANITGLGTAIEERSLFSKILTLAYKQALRKAECIFFQNQTNKKFFKKIRMKHRNIKCLPGSSVNLYGA